MRGLKYKKEDGTDIAGESHPAWDAWIEMQKNMILSPKQSSRIPHGMRGLKYICLLHRFYALRRIPHGMRGLKLLMVCRCRLRLMSHPAWDAWIEIWEEAV